MISYMEAISIVYHERKKAEVITLLHSDHSVLENVFQGDGSFLCCDDSTNQISPSVNDGLYFGKCFPYLRLDLVVSLE